MMIWGGHDALIIEHFFFVFFIILMIIVMIIRRLPRIERGYHYRSCNIIQIILYTNSFFPNQSRTVFVLMSVFIYILFFGFFFFISEHILPKQLPKFNLFCFVRKFKTSGVSTLDKFCLDRLSSEIIQKIRTKSLSESIDDFRKID